MHLIELCPQGPPPTQTAKATFAQRAHLMNDIPRGYGVVRGAIGLKKKNNGKKKQLSLVTRWPYSTKPEGAIMKEPQTEMHTSRLQDKSGFCIEHYAATA
jgi:hypothetical protein